MTLNLHRLLYQISLNLKLRWKTYGMLIIVSLVILVFNYFNKDFGALDFLNSRIGNTRFFDPAPDISIHKFHFKWFPQFLLYLSCIITSLSFSEYGSKTSRTFHLALPSSVLEKWLSKAIIALIISPICLIILYQVFIWISHLWPDVDEYYQVPVNVFDPYLRPHIINTILIQALVILLSIWYKKWSLVKAILAAVVIILVYNLIMIISVILFSTNDDLAKHISVQSFTSTKDFLRYSRVTSDVTTYSFFDVFINNKLYLGALASLSLVLSFLKFKEMEA